MHCDMFIVQSEELLRQRFYTASQCESIAESTDQTTPIKQRETGMPQFLHFELQNFFNLFRRIGCGESANETK